MACSKNLVKVLFDGPGHSHPPCWHLINNDVALRQFFNLLLNVIFFIHDGRADNMTDLGQMLGRDLRKFIVKCAIGQQIILGAIDN